MYSHDQIPIGLHYFCDKHKTVIYSEAYEVILRWSGKKRAPLELIITMNFELNHRL